MKKINKYLHSVQEDNIQEIDPLSVSLVGGTIYVVASLITFLTLSSELVKHIKVDNKFTKQLNDVMETKNEWIVHIYKTPQVNAFSLGVGRHIFLTSGLINILNDDEIMSVMLHEAWHSKAKHAYKERALKYPLMYLILFVGASMATTAGTFIVGILAIFIMKSVTNIASAITLERMNEYSADSFAAKKGYGPQLISSFKKIEKYQKSILSRYHCGVKCKVVNKLNDWLGEHPSDKKRIENILRKTNELNNVMKSKSYKKTKNFVTKNWR